jgi:hypothetical protein
VSVADTQTPATGRGVPPAVAFALSLAWGLLLAAAYALERDDLARLPAAVARLFEAPGGGEGPWAALARHAAAVVAAGAVSLACYGLGRLAGRALPARGGLPAWLLEALYFALGTGIGTVAVFAGGHAHLLRRGPALLLVALGLAALAATLWRDRKSLGPAVRLRLFELANDRLAWPSLAGIGLVGACALVLALAPPTARDALMYHLSVPKAYIAANGIVEMPENVMSYYPFGAEMLFMWAMLLGPHTAANLVHTAFWAVCVVLVYACVLAPTGRPRAAALAALAFACIPTGVFTAAIAHNEMLVCLYVLLAFVALGRWYVTGAPAAAVWFGLSYGLALNVKHLVIVMAPAFGLVVLLRAAGAERPKWARPLLHGAGAFLLAVAVASPWYLQNALRTGNPVYPFMWDLFPTHSPAWDRERALVFDAFLRTSWGQGGSIASLAAIPWNLSIRAAEGVNQLFDGIAGPAFLLLLPAAVLAFRTFAPEWRVVGALGALYALAWVYQSQQVRFLLPALCVGGMLGVAALFRPGAPARYAAARGAMLATLAIVLATNCLVAVARVAEENPVHVVLGLEAPDVYLARQLRYYPFYVAINRHLQDGARVFLIDMRNDTYYLDKPAFSDSVLEDYTAMQIVSAARGPDDVLAELRRRGLTHILVREDVFLNPELTPLDAEGIARWQAFLGRHARRILSDGAIALYAVNS